MRRHEDESDHVVSELLGVTQGGATTRLTVVLLLLLLLFVALVQAAPPADRLSHEVPGRARKAPLGFGTEILEVPRQYVEPGRKAPLGYGSETIEVPRHYVEPGRKAPLGYGTETVEVPRQYVEPGRKAPLGYGTETIEVPRHYVEPGRKAPLGYGTETVEIPRQYVEPGRKAPLGYGTETLEETPQQDALNTRKAPLGYGSGTLEKSPRQLTSYIVPTIDLNQQYIFDNPAAYPNFIYTIPLYNENSFNNDVPLSRSNYNTEPEQQVNTVPAGTLLYLVAAPQQRTTSPLIYLTPRQSITGSLQGYVTQAVGALTNQASNLLPSLPLTINVPDLVTRVVNRLSTGYNYAQQAWQNRPAYLRPTTPSPSLVTSAVEAETSVSNRPPVNVGPDPLDPEKKKPHPSQFGPL